MDLLIFVILIIFIDLFFGALIVPLPINDSGTVRYHSFPTVTVALIIVNILVFFVWQAPDLFDWLRAVTPEAERVAQMAISEKVWTFGFRTIFMREDMSIGAFVTFTSMFMHADFSHLAGNMIFLWAFGRRVEDACGPWRFLVFYLLAGMVANLGSGVIAADDLPSIGASGAIAGVMGAFIILFPGSRLDCVWILAIIVRIIGAFFSRLVGGRPRMKWTLRVPTLIVIALYVVSDVVSTFNTIGTGQLEGGVNYVAHTLGFLSSLAVFLFVRKDLFARYWAGRKL